VRIAGSYWSRWIEALADSLFHVHQERMGKKNKRSKPKSGKGKIKEDAPRQLIHLILRMIEVI